MNGHTWQEQADAARSDYMSAIDRALLMRVEGRLDGVMLAAAAARLARQYDRRIHEIAGAAVKQEFGR